MIQESMFNIPYWSIPTLNFKEKKKKLQSLCKRHPEDKHGIQTFSTNRQAARIQFKEDLVTILEEEFNMLSEKLKKDIQALNDGEKKFRIDSITMSDDVQNQTQKKLQEKRIEIQRTERELREDIDLRRREEVTKLQNQVTIVIEKIATSEKFDLILYTGVAYASDSVDITSKVIKELGALK